jgi:imidazoleglycerol-phosphate dehydratase/histidinol-phosphatase
MSGQKILFIDRDGTLIAEPEDEQIDSFEKLRFIDHAIPSLLALKQQGYQFVMVSNQDGLGTEAFPESDFQGPHDLMMQVFESQGIGFLAVHIDRSFPDDGLPTRKPGIGMLTDYLRSGELDFERSAVIGDRDTDLELAASLGIRGLRIGPSEHGGMSWPQIVAELRDERRVAEVRRVTSETDVICRIDLDDEGSEIATGIAFFDHMLDQVARHAGFALELTCRGDLEVDEHHSVEDCALALGQTLNKALGERRGIGRYGFSLPMDESLAHVAVDLSGRPALVFAAEFTRESVGGLATEMVRHFFSSLAQALGAAVHVSVTGENTHHMVEACFKGLGRALRPALARTEDGAVPSTKGVL